MTHTDYPFYCIEKVDQIELVRFLIDQLGHSYAWGIYFDCINLQFLEHKMHVFSIMVNKGFRI